MNIGCGRPFVTAGAFSLLIALVCTVAAPAEGPLVTEPRTGVTFAVRVGDMSLLGVGLRTKSFLKFKVYVLGLYVSDSALSGPLSAHRGRVGTSAFYRDLVVGDFEKEFVLKLVRDLSADQIQGTFRSHLPAADPRLLDQFVSYFGPTRAGQECVLRWVPDGRLEITLGGVEQLPIADKAFADDVFAIWLRDRPKEDPIRRQVVSRAGQLLEHPPASGPWTDRVTSVGVEADGDEVARRAREHEQVPD